MEPPETVDSVEQVLHFRREILCALTTSFAIAPLVAMVDKAIFSNASGKMDYHQSFRECTFSLLLTPKKFICRKSFFWSWSVYAATFIASNCSDRYARTVEHSSPRTTQFFATALVNIPMSTLRDMYLTQEYGTAKARPLHPKTYLAFIVRDLITIAGAFTSIRPVAYAITRDYSIPFCISQLVSQMICPIIAQLINTPVFLYGLDNYNRPYVSSYKRMSYIWNNYWNTYYWARLARVGPAYSVGGVINLCLRGMFTPPYPNLDKDK